jgi:Ca2+:H+ antiporter
VGLCTNLIVQVNYLIGDGKSHWLEGVLLMMMYLIIAIAAWYVFIPECRVTFTD